MRAGWWWWLVPALLAGLGSCEGKKDPDGQAGAGEAGADGPAYVLARSDRRLPGGTTITTTNSLTLTDALMTLERGGKKLMGTMTMKTDREVLIETLSETKTRITVVRDTQAVTHSVSGVEQPSEPSVHPLQGLAVTFTRTDGEWVGALDSGDASEEQAGKMEELARHLDDEEAIGMYGTVPRRVGDEWEVDPQRASFVGAGAEFKGSFRLRFDRLEQFEGTECAVLVGSINVSGQLGSEGEGGGEIKIVIPRAIIYRSLESLENLRSEYEGELFKAEHPEPGESALVRGPLRILQRSTVVLP